MRKFFALLSVFALLICTGASALAAGVTLRAFTSFADLDVAAQSYMDMITAWEEETGNVVEDYSGLTDEAWTDNMLAMARAGEADIVVITPGSGLTHEELVTVRELLEGTSELPVREFGALAEADGSVLLSPLRVSFEALYVNRDVLERYNLSAPGTYEELLALCAALSAQGVIPISNALGEWAEIVLDCAALAAGPVESFGGEESLENAREMLAALSAVGAFGGDTLTGSDMDAMQAFIDGQAAMRIDSDMLAQMIPQDRQGSVAVIPMPQRAGETHHVLCGTPGFGVAITRACWEDDARLEAALSFLKTMLGAENYQRLAVGVDGALGESIADMLLEGTDVSGILYDKMEGDFDSWSQGVIESLK